MHLNAGVATGCGVGDDFDLARYRRAMGANLDGVVFGVHAALPALRRRGGGAIVATASLAGLTGVPYDPLYAANKHAVVGLVRSLAPLAEEGIRVNAVCPGFAESRDHRPDPRRAARAAALAIIPAETVAGVVLDLLAGRGERRLRRRPAGARAARVRLPRRARPALRTNVSCADTFRCG